MKGFDIKASMSDGVTRGRRREDGESQNFLGCREEVLMINDEEGSVDCFEE